MRSRAGHDRHRLECVCVPRLWALHIVKRPACRLTDEAEAGAAAAVGGGDARLSRRPPHIRLAQRAQWEQDVAQRRARYGSQEV